MKKYTANLKDNGEIIKYNKYQLFIDDLDIKISDEKTPVTLDINQDLLDYIKDLKEVYFKAYDKKESFRDNFTIKLDFDMQLEIELNGFDEKEIDEKLLNKYENGKHKQDDEILDELLQESWHEKYFDFFVIICKDSFFIQAKSDYGEIRFCTENFNFNEKLDNK